MSFFSWCIQEFLFIFGLLTGSHYDVSGSVFICIYFALGSLSFLDLKLIFSIKFGKLSALISSKIFLPISSFSFWDSNYTYIVPYVSKIHFSLNFFVSVLWIV